MSLGPMLIHNNTNVLRVLGSDATRLKLEDVIGLGGANAFGYSAWIRPLSPLASAPYSENPDEDLGFLIGTSGSGWRLYADRSGVTAYRADDRSPFLTLPCRLQQGSWHFLRVGWSPVLGTSGEFRLTLAVDELQTEGFDASTAPPDFSFPDLEIGGGSLPIDLMCLSVWDDPDAIENNPALMPEHTPALKACFCFADPDPEDMSGHGVVLIRGRDSEQVGISRALRLMGGATAEVSAEVTDSLRTSGSNALTLHAWIRPAQLSWTDPDTDIVRSLDEAERDTIFALDRGDDCIRLDLRPATEGLRSNIMLNLGSAQAPLTVGTLQQGDWAHVALTADGSTWRVYLDGTLAGEAEGSLGSLRRIALGGLEGGHFPDTQFRGHICSFGLWSKALSGDRIRTIRHSLEFLDDDCLAWFGLGDSLRLADSLLGSPLILRGGGGVEEVVGQIAFVHEDKDRHVRERFRKSATAVPASAAWDGLWMAQPTSGSGPGEHVLDVAYLRASVGALRPGMDAARRDRLADSLAELAYAAARGGRTGAPSARVALMASTSISSRCAGLLVAIVCDVIAIIFSAVGFAVAGSVVRNAIGGSLTRNIPKLVQTLKAIDFAKVEGIRASTPIFLRLISALFGTTSGMPSLRAIIQSVFSEFRWWDVAFFAANVGLLVASIILTGGGAVIVILATLGVALGALARDIALYVEEGCHQQ